MHRISSLARLLAGALVGGLAATLPLRSAGAADAYPIHVIEPLTGGGSFIGKGQQDNLTLLEAYANAAGGIQGRPVHFVFHDNQSSPQLTVQIANDVVAGGPAVLLGTPITAQCNAIAPLMKKGPVLYCLTPGVHPAESSYEFSTSVSTYDLITTLVRFFRLQGWTKLAVLTSTDSSGQDADRGIDLTLGRSENAGMTPVVHEHFNPTDVSIAAQIERVAAAKPQALIAWTTGAPVATIFRGLKQAGLDIPVGTTNGNQIFSQMAQYAGFLPRELYFPSSLFPEHKGLLELDPRVEKAQQDMLAVLTAGGVKPDNQTGMVWDPALIVIAALRQIGPGATPEQVRQYIAGLAGFAGINGIYDFKASPQRGLGVENAAVFSYDGEGPRWLWMSKPGGELL
jgi:branched-chain amino acid transport system substrate-binding protein